jgi:steroid delta-isomerase-like uncharacterized protein
MSDAPMALLAAYNDRDAFAAAALYALDGEHYEVAQRASRRGREALRASLEGFFGAFPDARWQVSRSVLDAQACAIAYRLTGTLAAPLGPFRPAGQQLDIEGILLIEIDTSNDQIARSSDYWDSGTFARQMRVD